MEHEQTTDAGRRQQIEHQRAIETLVDRIIPHDEDDNARAFVQFINLIVNENDPIQRESLALAARNRAYSRTLNFHAAMDAFSNPQATQEANQ